MDVVIYTDSNVNVPLNAYTRLINSMNLLFEDDLHFIMYSLETDTDTEILVNMLNDLNDNNPDKEITHDVILRPSYIKEYTPDNDTGRNLLIEDTGLFHQLHVLKHDKVLFVRVGHGISSDVICDTNINPSYDVSGMVINTYIIQKLLKIISLKDVFVTGEMLRLIIDTFVDPKEIKYYQVYKDTYYSENKIHNEGLWDLYTYLVNNIYDKLPHKDQFNQLNLLRQ